MKKVLINDSIDPIKMPGTEVSFPRQEYDMRLEALIQNMTDQIKEAQLKLGYARETMRLYYPLSSLNAMLEIQETDIRELAKKIRHELEGRYPDSDPRRSDRLYDPAGFCGVCP